VLGLPNVGCPNSAYGIANVGFVAVDADAIAGEGELARWLDAAAGYAAWLPPK
jgi:hypothetical protein